MATDSAGFRKLNADIIGQPIDKARQIAREIGFTLRVSWRDNKPVAGTGDMDVDRVSVKTENGIVTEVLNRG